MPNVDIYSSDTCTYCHLAKEFFKNNNIEYTEHNISKDMDARKTLMKKGVMSVPFIIINNEEVLGFDEEKIKTLLNL